jgi:hypothetical protein
MKELAHHEGPDYEPHDLPNWQDPSEYETTRQIPGSEPKKPADQTTQIYENGEALKQTKYPFLVGVRL